MNPDLGIGHEPPQEDRSLEMLSVLGAAWVMAIEPHLDYLVSIADGAADDAPLVSPKECAHSIASISEPVA